MSRADNALVHGACSPRLIAAKARANKRRFLRRDGLRASDLDAVTSEYLTQWARGAAILDLREAGDATESKDYWTAYNGTRRCLERLEKRLAALGLDRRSSDDPFEAFRRGAA